MNWGSVLLLLALVLMTASSCTGVDNEKVISLQAELDSVETQIASAEKENEKYTGGLVKALINSQIETLKQTRAMLQQRRHRRGKAIRNACGSQSTATKY